MSDQIQNRLDVAAAGLKEVAQEFADEIERKPSSDELFEVLTYALNSMSTDSLSDVNVTQILGLRPEIEPGIGQPDNYATHRSGSVVAELNDSTFVAASDVLWQLIKSVNEERGQAPTLDTLLKLLLESLHRSDNLLIDVSPRYIMKIRPEFRK
jgi:hypothetical protein